MMKSFKNIIRVSFLFAFILLVSCNSRRSINSVQLQKCVGTWATAPLPVEPGNMLPIPGLANNTIRQLVRVSTGGEKLRLRFSNAFSKSQSGVKYLLLLESIYDIGGIRNAADAPKLARELIDVYSLRADKAHSKNIKVYGCPILPFVSSFYDKPFRQQARDMVNEWMRSTDKFDALIDFDKAMRNPDDVKKYYPVYMVTTGCTPTRMDIKNGKVYRPEFV